MRRNVTDDQGRVIVFVYVCQSEYEGHKYKYFYVPNCPLCGSNHLHACGSEKEGDAGTRQAPCTDPQYRLFNLGIAPKGVQRHFDKRDDFGDMK